MFSLFFTELLKIVQDDMEKWTVGCKDYHLKIVHRMKEPAWPQIILWDNI